ncbi:MAG: penicillin-binding protein 2 [Desulfobacteraceae bacterium]
MRTSGFDPALAEIINRRLKVITVFIIAIISALLLRLWFLQIVNGSAYRVQSENNRIHLQSIPPYRGLITDRNGELLVNNIPSYDLIFIPEDVQDADKLILNLKRLISLDFDNLSKKLKGSYSGKPFEPVLIKKGISREELAVIKANLFNLPGIDIQDKPQRNYIYGTLASHIVGYLSEIDERELKSGKYNKNRAGDFIGKYGIERRWQNQLNGTSGAMQEEKDVWGRKLNVISRQPAIPGYNINLTIDKDLQLLAEASFDGKSGAIVALDPKNGEVLAMASSPPIDPNKFVGGIKSDDWNQYANSKDAPLQNRAIASMYPPGSIFKIVTAFAGLEEGIIDPEEKVFCDGVYTFGNHSYNCWKRHGEMNLQDAILNSCDYYFYKAGKNLGIENIAKYARMFGLGKKTNINFDYDKDGLIPDKEWKLKKYGVPWQIGDTISSAIGQSYVSVTPIQMASLISTVFNGGRIYQPGVVKRVGSDTEAVFEFSPKLKRIIDVHDNNMELIKKALIAVVNDPHGTGKNARVKGITVAGKTGTVELINKKKLEKLYPDGDFPAKYENHAWFVAVAPAEDPVIAIAVLIEHGGSGSGAAAPVAGKLIKQYLK